MVFPPLKFSGQLRPSQRDATAIARQKLAEGHRKLHIVAPPGSGKTVLGLYLWAECVKRPAVVLSPNSAIQTQWIEKARTLFVGEAPSAGRNTSEVSDMVSLTSIDARAPGLLTSLTYQAVTLPKRGDTDLDAPAAELWVENLIEREQASDEDEARCWIDDLKRHNPEYHAQRLSAYRKQYRDMMAQSGESLPFLHTSSQAVLQRLKDCEVGLIILDECHHLMGHWGRVLADACSFLDNPIVIGLTATPPDRDGKPLADVERYEEFFGPVDYEVPIPAVVKDGFLAPYQDLAYFVRPTPEEIDYIANIDDQFHALVTELCEERTSIELGQISNPDAITERHSANTSHGASAPDVPSRIDALPEWLFETLRLRRHPMGVSSDWSAFEKRDPSFVRFACDFLLKRGRALPDGVPLPVDDVGTEDSPDFDRLVPVIDRYVRHGLRRSLHSADRELAERTIRQMRLLGVQITELGCQSCASPAGRVIAYSKSKMTALPAILHAEKVVLGERIRAVVVSDFEKTSAVTADVSHLLDEEAGGAISAFRTLISHPNTQDLDAILLTGSSVLIDADIAVRIKSEAEEWLRRQKCDVVLNLESPLGTKSTNPTAEKHPFAILNGEGADWCPRVYVALITELFQRGVTRCLVGTRGLLGEGWDAHKINVLIDITTVTTSMSVNQLRGRSFRLDPDEPHKVANNWDIVCLAPEFSQGLDDYHRLIRKHGQIFGVTEDGVVEKGIGHVHAAFTELKPEGIEGSVAALNDEMLARAGMRSAARERWKIGQPYRLEPVNTVEVKLRTDKEGGFPPFRGSRSPWSDASLSHAVGRAVLESLIELQMIEPGRNLVVGERSGGYVRLFLENAKREESALYADSLQEIFAPLHKPRYVIPRTVDYVSQTWLSRLLPRVMGRYFERRETKLAIWHCVPSVFAKNKDVVSVFEKHWQRHVSPTTALYALSGEGAQVVKKARAGGLVSTGPIHVKEVFL